MAEDREFIATMSIFSILNILLGREMRVKVEELVLH